MTDQVKAREIEVDFSIVGNPLFSERVKMIEKSAYESVVRERDELREKQDKFNHSRFAQLERNISIKDAEIAKLKEELERLKASNLKYKVDSDEFRKLYDGLVDKLIDLNKSLVNSGGR